MKVSTMYGGWDAEKEKEGRSTLVGKTVFAGMEKATEFHEKREACIRKRYNADGIKLRILNGDGGGWVEDPYDPDAIVQLDRYHIYQDVLRKAGDRKAQKEIRRLPDGGKPDGMPEYIKTYAEGAGDMDGKGRKAMELYSYLENNREGLLPYDRRGIAIPEPGEGIVYRGMGVQENQNCTLITLRMKHRRMRWSAEGANNLAKALYRRENGELAGTVERLTDGLAPGAGMQEAAEALSAAKAPKKDGRGGRSNRAQLKREQSSPVKALFIKCLL